jgi:hypothetical protein
VMFRNSGIDQFATVRFERCDGAHLEAPMRRL